MNDDQELVHKYIFRNAHFEYNVSLVVTHCDSMDTILTRNAKALLLLKKSKIKSFLGCLPAKSERREEFPLQYN